MFKRPCCLLAAGILFIQLILVGWFQISRDLKPSYLEQNYLENENVIIEGKVYDVDKRTSYSVYYLKDIQVYRKSTWVKINRERVLVNVKDSDSIMVGNIIQAAGKIYFFQGNRNPGNFNQKFYYQKQHIHAQIWSTQIQINNQKTDLLKENLFEIRESIKNMLLHSLGKDAGNSMAAILLGDKKDLDQTIKQLYQKGGNWTHSCNIRFTYVFYRDRDISSVKKVRTRFFSFGNNRNTLFAFIYDDDWNRSI